MSWFWRTLSKRDHRAAGRGPAVVICRGVACVAMGILTAYADDDVTDIAAKPAATAPGEVTGPSTQGVGDALGTMHEKIPQGSRIGVVTLSNGVKIEGRVWTTLETPLRLWIEELKAYRDVDLSLVKRIDVKVLAENMEDDWRWLKEGSDQKIFSGKKYPNVELAYKLTLLNEQVLEGTIVAPIYTFDGEKRRTLALYKKYHGKLDETLNDVVYIKNIELAPAAAATQANDSTTRKLPLIY